MILLLACKTIHELPYLVLTIRISIHRTVAIQCRHHGCECPDGWEGDHCELQIKKASSMASDVAEEVGEALTGNSIVWIILIVVMGIFVAIYFRRYHYIKQKGKRSKRRQRRNQQEMASFSDDTRDII